LKNLTNCPRKKGRDEERKCLKWATKWLIFWLIWFSSIRINSEKEREIEKEFCTAIIISLVGELKEKYNDLPNVLNYLRSVLTRYYR